MISTVLSLPKDSYNINLKNKNERNLHYKDKQFTLNVWTNRALFYVGTLSDQNYALWYILDDIFFFEEVT